MEKRPLSFDDIPMIKFVLRAQPFESAGYEIGATASVATPLAVIDSVHSHAKNTGAESSVGSKRLPYLQEIR